MEQEAEPIIISTEKKVVADFMMARGTAIAAYAEVEQALVELFSVLMRASPDYAGVSFFRINNARARNSILDRLLKKRHESKYNLFWNPLVKQLTTLDGKRNQIVHWGLLPVLGEGRVIKKIKLTPPNYWDRTTDTPKMSVDDLDAFIRECRFMSRALSMLRHVSSGKKPKRKAWRDICQRPTIYPPPENHLLSQSAPALRIPPVPFRK